MSLNKQLFLLFTFLQNSILSLSLFLFAYKKTTDNSKQNRAKVASRKTATNDLHYNIHKNCAWLSYLVVTINIEN